MKKLVAGFLAVLMAVVLTACAGGDASTSDSSGSSQHASQEETQSGDTQKETQGSEATGDTQSSEATDGTQNSEAASDTQGSETADDTQGSEAASDTQSSGKKILVAYFSATGTTKQIAEHAAKAMNADLYEITPEEPYSAADLDYNDKKSRSTKEMNDESCRPAINGSVKNMADYDIVFIGYPIWWGEAPRIVSTFVESYDFSGKTVVTFCTSGSSAHNDKGIKKLVKGADWITGKRQNSSASRKEIADWINSLGLDIRAE